MTTTTKRFGMLVAMVVLAACGQQPTLRQLQISPVVTEVTENLQAEVVATAIYSDGSKQDVTAEVTWSTEDAGVAGAAAGRIQAGAPGRTYVVAAWQNLRTSARVDVVAATLLSLQVQVEAATVPAGLSTRLTALGTFSDGSVRDVTSSVQWSSSGAVELRAGALVRGLSPGLAMVLGSIGGHAAAARLEVVDATAQSLSLVGVEHNMPVGAAAGFQVLATYSDGTVRDVTAEAALQLVDLAVAALDGANLRALAAGLTELRASFGGLEVTAPVAIAEARTMTIEVQASRVDVRAGQLVYFTATALLTDGTSRDVTREITWTTSSAQVAIVSNYIQPGAVLAFTPGEVDVVATDPVTQATGSYHLIVAP